MNAPAARSSTRWLLIVIAVVCVGLQFPGRLSLSALALVVWLSVLALWERGVARRLWRPRFLAITVGLALLSGLFLGSPDMTVVGVALSSSGLQAGALMVVRGVLIFGLTAWGTTLLSERRQRDATALGAGGPLGTSVAVAVRLIPDLTDGLRAAWITNLEMGRGRLATLRVVGVDLVFQAVRIAEELARDDSSRVVEERVR
jgi:hypothetical protein